MGPFDQSDDAAGMGGSAAVVFAGGCWLIVDDDWEEEKGEGGKGGKGGVYIPGLPKSSNVTFDVAGDSLILVFNDELGRLSARVLIPIPDWKALAYRSAVGFSRSVNCRWTEGEQ